MSEKKTLYVFIRNVDEYLRGDYSWCFVASIDPNYGGEPGDEFYYPYLTEIEFDPKSVSTVKLTKIALDIIDKEIKKEEAGHNVKLEILKDKRSKLLFLDHTTTGDEK